MLKNRSQAPTPAQVDKGITLAKLVAPSQNDSNKWSETKGATISGYLVDAHYGKKESCNCDSNNPNMMDIHVELVTDPAYAKDKSKRFVAELTRNFPNLRKWTPDTLKPYFGKSITVTGWMFFDPDHKNDAENTSPGGPHNWRATSWEIHPITSISMR
ncbi:MAG: hypothetical protein KGI07_05775 [Thaumarchaeota archaeon]|nr:hypothetical protein [Nitrososphaerota archaeon]